MTGENGLAPYSIAIIGLGKIAVDQHVPVIGKNADFTLAAIVSGRGASTGGVPTFREAADLYAALPDLDAVAICTPPQVRYTLAREALNAGKHVLLEKPPALTVAELLDLGTHAADLGRVIFTTWHSQYNAGVDEAKRRLEGKRIAKLNISWKEDVRRWHPGQEWIWQVGGFGVFDPGINALSILTKIMPGPVFVRSADLITPANRDMPIAATLTFASPAATDDATLSAAFDWRQTGEQSWTIDVTTEEGTALRLEGGGSTLLVDGKPVVVEPMAEYEGIYVRFADLLKTRTSQIDAAPFQLVADAFMVGKRVVTDAFEE
jgi:D-galactose 1-dehydrogenase